MKKIGIILAAAILTVLPLKAQEGPSQEEFQKRYDLLVSKLGPTGVGIETLLTRWERAYPDDPNMLLAQFSYWFSKSQTTKVEKLDRDKYLGNAPVLPLKDSLGNKTNFFEVRYFDDEMYGKASKALDKVIALAPDQLDYRLLKANALISYEKESPDMALSHLKGLIDYHFHNHPTWKYPGIEMDANAFDALMQEYCFAFFKLGCPGGYDAFRELSEKMLQYEPKNTLFLTNLGTWELVAHKDPNAAMKQYTKVLKMKPGDYTVLKNIILLARSEKNIKLEKKYLPQLIKATSDETERASYEVRLKSLAGKS